MTQERFTLSNRIESLSALADAIEAFGERNGLPRSVVNDVNVALDEHLNNILSYAYVDGDEHEIIVDIETDNGSVIVAITDDGLAFDPLAVPTPEVSGSIGTRAVGGLGIHFIRSLMDECRYERKTGRNRLVLRKKISS